MENRLKLLNEPNPGAMKISELAVKNYQFTIVIFLLLIALGVYSYIKIPQAEDPEFPISIFPIVAIYPGASPTDIEQLVVDKIEKSLNELEDIQRIKTEINDGVALIVVEFYSYTIITGRSLQLRDPENTGREYQYYSKCLSFRQCFIYPIEEICGGTER
jgi:hypothetical protein